MRDTCFARSWSYSKLGTSTSKLTRYSKKKYPGLNNKSTWVKYLKKKVHWIIFRSVSESITKFYKSTLNYKYLSDCLLSEKLESAL